MLKILVTGSNGLIGEAVVNELQKKNNVEIYGVARSINPSVQTITIDLGKDFSPTLLPEQADVIIHLAQSRDFRDFPNSAEKVFQVNTSSTLKLLEYARKANVKKFIYASSGGIYGNGNDEFTEESAVSIRSDLGFYLSTKFCSELLVQNYAPFFSIDILRFFFVFGETQKKDMLIPRLVDSVYRGIPVTLQGHNGLKINPVYVSDAAKAVIACLDLKGNNRINIAGGEILTLREICQIIGDQLRREPLFDIKNSEPSHLVADISRMKQLLHTPEVSFREAIKKLTSSYE